MLATNLISSSNESFSPRSAFYFTEFFFIQKIIQCNLIYDNNFGFWYRLGDVNLTEFNQVEDSESCILLQIWSLEIWTEIENHV